MTMVYKDPTTSVVYETKVLLNNSGALHGFEMQELIQDGWEIDPDMPLALFGHAFEVRMRREIESPETPEGTPDTALLKEVVMTAAQQRMAKARAARKAK